MSCAIKPSLTTSPQHLCNPDYISLPPYSQIPDSTSSIPAAAHPALSVLSDGDIYVPPPLINPAPYTNHSPGPASGSHTPIRSPSASARPSISATSSISGHPSTSTSTSPGPGHLHRMESGLSEESLPSGAQSPVGPTATVISPPLSRRHSLQERATTELFEQLIAGEVSEEGEAPPSYEAAVEASVTSSVAGSHSHAQ